MPLPSSEIKGTTILFEVEVDLNAPAADAVLTYLGEGTYSPDGVYAPAETFMITSLVDGGITLLSSVEVDGVYTYKWRCRVAPELTRDLVNDVFTTYCRLFFGDEVVELERSQLTLTKGKPDLRPQLPS